MADSNDKIDKNGEIHTGHRQRVRNRIATVGFESLPDHEFVEYLLFHVIPRRDVNPLAHELLNTFKNINGLFSATKEELRMKTKLSDKTIDFLVNYGSCIREYMRSRKQVLESVAMKGGALEFIRRVLEEDKEVLVVLLTDQEGKFKLYREFSLENGLSNELFDEVCRYMISAEARYISIIAIVPDYEEELTYCNPFYKYSIDNIKNFSGMLEEYIQSFVVNLRDFAIVHNLFSPSAEIYYF